MSCSDTHSDPGELTCWLVDTRKIWPGTNIRSADGASQMLDLISKDERTNVLNKHFIQDARMSLTSALLKRLYVSKTLGIPWAAVRLGRKGHPEHGKPCAVDSTGAPIVCVDFNVSHQAGLVALIGWCRKADCIGVESRSGHLKDDSEVHVGVDIVCVNERNDYRVLDNEGLETWVDIYEGVFSDEARWSMKYDVDQITLPDGTTLTGDDLGRHDRCMVRNKQITLTTPDGKRFSFSSALIVEAKLRRFYAYFCYTEAYVKLAGEALLAPWLKELQFFNVRSPKPAPSRAQGPWGEVIEDVDVRLKRRKVEDVRVNIRAFEEDRMISAMVQGEVQHLQLPPFTMVDFDDDFFEHASTMSVGDRMFG